MKFLVTFTAGAVAGRLNGDHPLEEAFVFLLVALEAGFLAPITAIS
jgi:hypothetical protein